MTTKSKPITNNLKGKNSDSLRVQFDDRAAYTIGHPYIWDEEFPVPINFWTLTNAFYGRIDQNKDLIVPDPNKMKQVSSYGKQDVYALNFVCDAFEDFTKFLKIKKAKKLLADDNFTADWSAKRGWNSIDSYYDGYIDSLVSSFTGEYLNTTGKHKSITSFSDFLAIMVEGYLMNVVDQFPVTKTGLVYSRFNSPMSSALCIEISTADHGDDEFKYRNFINNENFKLYSLAASKFGFLVDKNAPWRLVANLNSKQMKSYIAKYLEAKPQSGKTDTSVGFHCHEYYIDENGNGKTTSFIPSPNDTENTPEHTHEILDGFVQPYNSGVINHGHNLEKTNPKNFNVQDVYKSFYRKTIFDDLGRLKSLLFTSYNEYVDEYESVTVYNTCKQQQLGTGLTEQFGNLSSFDRKPITMEQINKNYPDIFWLNLFFRLRLKELKADIPAVNLNYNLKKLSILNKTVDFSAALKYSERYLKQYY